MYNSRETNAIKSVGYDGYVFGTVLCDADDNTIRKQSITRLHNKILPKIRKEIENEIEHYNNVLRDLGVEV